MTLFTGWSEELATCRKFVPTARNYTAAKLMVQVGLRVSVVAHDPGLFHEPVSGVQSFATTDET